MDGHRTAHAIGDAAIRADIDEDFGQRGAVSPHGLRTKIALGCRLLSDHGHARTLAGQITGRADDGRGFWTTCLGDGFGEIQPERLLRFDDRMSVVEGTGKLNPGVRFHLWIYSARPDVRCIVHTHPPFASSLSQTGKPLVAAHMDTAMFHDDCAHLADWPGVPVGDEEGQIIDSALGDKRSILLANHGLLTTGRTFEEAIYLAVLFEHAAEMQLLAMAAGGIQPIRPEMARDAHEFLTKPKIIDMTVAYWFRQTARRHPDALG